MTSLGPLRHPQTTRNYRPKTGKVLVTAANIIGFICIFADEQRDRSVWYSRLLDDLREQLHAEKWEARSVFVA